MLIIDLSVKPERELTEQMLKTIVRDFDEGVHFEYLIVRLHLLNVKVNEDKVRKLIWKLIDERELILTLDYHLRISTQEEKERPGFDV